MTKHPEGKMGVNIEKGKYEMVKAAILKVLNQFPEIEFVLLGGKVKDIIGKDFDGSVSWYYATVKLDLEARGIIERVPESRPQKLRIKQRR
ncbi:MAG: DUF6958 family protein [Candidatus Thorarchaeota archaeon]|jgi:hypothetical protein